MILLVNKKNEKYKNERKGETINDKSYERARIVL